MPKIVFYTSALCGALPVRGAEIYVNGVFCGLTDDIGFSSVIKLDGKSCTFSVRANGYDEYRSENVTLYKDTTVVRAVVLKVK